MHRSFHLETLRTYYEDKDWMLDRIDRLEIDLRILTQSWRRMLLSTTSAMASIMRNI